MKGNPEILNALNDLLRGELTAVDQYLAHGELLADMGLAKLAEHAIHESDIALGPIVSHSPHREGLRPAIALAAGSFLHHCWEFYADLWQRTV